MPESRKQACVKRIETAYRFTRDAILTRFQLESKLPSLNSAFRPVFTIAASHYVSAKIQCVCSDTSSPLAHSYNFFVLNGSRSAIRLHFV
jgi:hypothetical protein